uniref:Uncharacterized protein n=1 Tax=Trichuris muris TaxID=70415 RepID=A0A5S6QFD0_TRIMR
MNKSNHDTPTNALERTVGGEEAVSVIAAYPGPFKCPRTAPSHGLIVHRHDVIVRKLTSLAEASGFTVTVEPTLRHDDQVYKPDLIAVKGGKAWVLDVAIPFESNDALARRYAEKCRKYTCLADPVLKLTGAKEFGTGSIVIGARGAWCSRNAGTLKEMAWNISEPCKALLCVMTLERTNQLVHASH